MIAALPSRIMDYDVSAESPSEELITIGQILSEVGDYASTMLDKVHLSFSSRCAAKLDKVLAELTARACVKSSDDLYETDVEIDAKADLSSMTISELHSLYRGWPQRQEQRRIEGRQHLTFYFEGKIVRELRQRKAATTDEQLKIDYCEATYANELDNLSFIFSCPVDAGGEKIYPEPGKEYSCQELVTLIRRYSTYRDVMERELLVEYVDKGLEVLRKTPALSDARQLRAVISTVANDN